MRKQILFILLWTALTAAVDFNSVSASFSNGPHGGSSSWPPRPWSGGFIWEQPEPEPPLFSSLVQSSSSNSKRSRSEENLREVLTNSRNREWTHGFQDNGKGGLQKLDSSNFEEKSAGRTTKDLKASESGESSQRDQRLTQVNGKTILNSDSGKESSFSNSGHVVNRTEFSSETNSKDSRLAKVVLPPAPQVLVDCFGRTRTSLVFLVQPMQDLELFTQTIGFLEAFLGRLTPFRAAVAFFNSRGSVLDVVDYTAGNIGSEALRRRLLDAGRTIHDGGDFRTGGFDLSEGTVECARLRQRLRLPAPCTLVLVTPDGSFRADDRALEEARRAAALARQSFDQLTCVVGRSRALEPRAVELLSLFSTGGQRDLLQLAFGGGGSADAESADVLGRRVCDASVANPARFEEPGGPRLHAPMDWRGGN